MLISQALEFLAPSIAPTTRLATIPLVIRGDVAFAYNGFIAATVPITNTNQTFALDAEKFHRIWKEGSSLSVAEVFVTIKRGKSQFRLLRIDPNNLPVIDFLSITDVLTAKQQACIKLASKFASKNALHKWACGVSVSRRGVIATNNQTLVFVPCEFPFDLTFPYWAVEALPATGEDVGLGWNEGSIVYGFSGGGKLQSQRLTEEMPPVVATTAEELKEAAVPFAASSLLTDLQDLRGRYCIMNEGAMTIEAENGELATTEIGVEGNFKMTVEAAELIFSVATHIDFKDTPKRLRFSKQTEPVLYGFAAGMV